MPRVPLPARLHHRADVAAAVLVLLVASALRLAFLFRAPPFFVGGDSETYLQPAMELLWGQGFELIAKRPPGYPLFVATTLASLGQDLQTLNLVQSALGVLTSAAAWAIGRLTFGRIAGLVAGLLVAANGTLIIFEHYVMAEALFTFLVTMALLLLLLATRDVARRWLVGAGLAIGLATMTRQTALLLIPLGPIALWLAGYSPRGVLRGTSWYLAGFLVLVGPWVLADFLPDRTLAAGTLGETLVWRLTRSDSDFFKGRQASAGDAASIAARRFAWDQASGKELPSDTAVRLQQRFGLSEAEADRVLRDVAFEAIGQQPARYVASSAQIFITHLFGQEQYLGGQGKEGGRTRFANVETRYAFWDERARFLLNDPTQAQQ
ncbi:MAG: glycosyltransferase family 39 protein, partial [Chloroflexi bacterium]|nr:glycosyltransferase family 39 protein [Chloroflexota bacterium]